MTIEPGPGAFGLSEGAPYQEEDQMPSCPVFGVSHGDVDFFSPPAVGPGGGTG